jgi:diguanylate cyclase (GGDEF)-like protein
VVCAPGDDPVPHRRPGDVIDRVLDDASGNQTDRNVLLVDEYDVWVSGEAPVADERGAIVGLIQAIARPEDDWPDATGTVVTGGGGAFAAAVGSATARLGKARVDAVTDGLTGLYNQRYFKQRLAEESARAADLGTPLSLLFCDLDDFKGFNDRHGHAAGDRALRAVASTMLRSLRQVDMAARYGGEEFTVILIDTEPAGALDVAERIRGGVAALTPDHGVAAALSVSIGVASFPAHATTVEELLDKADWAMYLAKRHGRDRVMPFSAASPGPGVTAE